VIGSAKSLKKSILAFLGTSLFLVGCSTMQRAPSGYFESSLDDKNRVDARLAPPSEIANDKNIDPLYLQTQADYHYAAGESFSYEGQYQKAIEHFRSALIYDQKSSSLNVRLANEYLRIGLSQEALKQTEEAIQKDTKSVDARLLRGAIFTSIRSFDEAIEEYSQAIRINPKAYEARLYLGALLSEVKQYDQSKKQFQILAEDKDYENSYLAYFYLGKIYSELKQSDLAEKSFRKSIEEKSDYIESILALSKLIEKSKGVNSAIQFVSQYQKKKNLNLKIAEYLAQKYLELEKYDLAYEQLVILDSQLENQMSIKLKIALILIESKKFDEAQVKLNEILVKVPESDKARYYLALIYEERKQDEDALLNYKLVNSKSPYYPESVVRMTRLAIKSGNKDEVNDLLKEAMKLRPDIPQFYILKASLLDEDKKYSLALEIVNQGIEKFPDFAQFHFFSGVIHDHMGSKDKVVESMNKAIEVDPNHAQALNYLAYTYSEMNTQLEKAEVIAKRAVALEPKDGFILDTLGWIQFKRKNFKSALENLRKAHELQPGESIIAEHLGDVYFQMQLISKAKSMYEKAIENESNSNKIEDLKQKILSINEQSNLKRRPAAAGN